MKFRKGDQVGLFILNPGLSAIYSICHIKDRTSHYLLYCWFLVFGCAFCVLNEAADSYRWVEIFQYEHKYSLSQYLIVVKDYFTFTGNVKDIYSTTVNFIVGRFSDNYHWTYLIYAAVFGLFYLKSLKIFLRNQIGETTIFYLLLFMFCFSNPIFNINGMRFWTASWIGVYASLKFFIDKDYKVLLLLPVMPLVHGTTMVWAMFILIAFITSRFQNIWIVLFIASSFVSGLSALDFVGDFSYLLPQFLQNQIWSYTESDYALERIERESQVNGYWDILNALPQYFMLLMAILLIIRKKEINVIPHRKQIFTVILALLAMSNFVSSIPSMGRFQYFCIPLIVVFWTMNYEVVKRYNSIFYFVPLVYAYALLYWFRRMVSVTELYLYVMPAPLTVIKYLFLS